MQKTTKYFLLGTMNGVFMFIAPWWVGVATVILVGTIIEVWSGHDGPAQA